MSQPNLVAAFFDLDGTLLPPPSLEWRFIRYLLWHGKIGTPNIFRWLGHAGHSIGRGPRRAIEANKQYLGGLSASLVVDWANSPKAEDVNLETRGAFAEGLQRIRWHQAQNHRVFLLTGTLAPLANDFATRLPGNVEVIATDLSDFGTRLFPHPRPRIWTGELAAEHMVGAAKCRALRATAGRHHLDLTGCYAYGNSIADRAMLEAVGHPTAVNPSRSLARLARKRCWPVSRWVAAGATRGKTSTRLVIPNAFQNRHQRNSLDHE
jgi:phosphoserine phosphatase